MVDIEKLIELQEISSRENAELKQQMDNQSHQMAKQTDLITKLLGSVNLQQPQAAINMQHPVPPTRYGRRS